METTKRRGFFQRLLGLIGGAAGATALQNNTLAGSAPAPVRTSFDGAIRLQMKCRRHSTESGRSICRATLLDQPEGQTVGEFHANSFQAESPLGAVNPFSASHIEMQTIRLADGTLFGMGANEARETEKVHAIIGGTGRFAGARGTYAIRDSGAEEGALELTIKLLNN